MTRLLVVALLAGAPFIPARFRIVTHIPRTAFCAIGVFP
jgi:hypothetical protein